MPRDVTGGAKPLDYVFLLRPVAMVPLWTFVLYGAALAASGGVWPPRAAPLVSADVWLTVLAMTLILGGGYIQNQIADIETDRRNDKLFLIPLRIVSVRAAVVELALVWLAAALVALRLSVEFRWIAAASLVLSITYSAPPVRAKARAPLDLLWNGIGFGALGAAAGWSAVAPFVSGIPLRCAAYAMAVAGVIASTTILDVQGDRALGLGTTAAALGVRRTSALGLALVTGAAALGWHARDPLALWGSVLSLPLLIRAHLTARRADRILGNQVAVAAFACVAALWAPPLIVLLVGTLAAARAYYRARFGIRYPGPGTP